MTGVVAVTSAGHLVHDVSAAALLLAPAVLLHASASRDGAGQGTGLDLVAVSLAVALAHVALVRRRRRRARRPAEDAPVDRVTAALTGLVVLGVSAPLLPAAVLAGFTGLPAGAVDPGPHALALWGALQVVAAVLAEGARAVVLRWLRASSVRRSMKAP